MLNYKYYLEVPWNLLHNKLHYNIIIIINNPWSAQYSVKIPEQSSEFDIILMIIKKNSIQFFVLTFTTKKHLLNCFLSWQFLFLICINQTLQTLKSSYFFLLLFPRGWMSDQSLDHRRGLVPETYWKDWQQMPSSVYNFLEQHRLPTQNCDTQSCLPPEA